MTVMTELEELRDRVLPMMRHVQREYEFRVRSGFPIVVDAPAQGMVGLELDANFSLYFLTDGDSLVARVSYRSSRYDTRSTASREKFGGATIVDDRPIDASVDDAVLRNLIAELMSRFNQQQTMLYFTDQ